MKYNKFIYIAYLIILPLFSFVFYPQNSFGKKKSLYKIKLAFAAPEGSPWAKTGVKLKKDFLTATNNKVKMRIYYGGILGDEITALKRCISGPGIYLWAGSAGSIATVIPEISVLELPYLFLNENEVDYIVNKNTIKEIIDLLDKYGFTLYMPQEVGWRSFASMKKPVKNVNDLRGLKVRSQQNPVHLLMWNALGAKPLPIGVTEVAKVLNADMLDGLDNTPTFLFATSWYKFVKYFSLTNHMYQPGFVVFSKNHLQKIPKELRVKMFKNNRLISDFGRNGLRSFVKKDVFPMMKQSGVEIVDVHPDELLKFKEKLKTVYIQYKKTALPSSIKLLETIQLKLTKFRKNKK